MNKKIAMYLRLSRDDNRADESNSITSQRSIINDFISSIADFNDVSVVEYVDDGYSGTNFGRPGIQDLLHAVTNGEIRCVIVKDFSRFGRNFIEVGKFIEMVFPFLDIRFIAINDHYDSNDYIGSSVDIDVAFRNLMNALYSKDISKKVKSAKCTKALQGMNINAFVPYGYKKSAANKHSLEIDEPAAKIVKRIFELYCEGQRPTKIARILNSECVLTPSDYKKHIGSNLKSGGATSSLWSSGSVNNILHNEQYVGTYIVNRTGVNKIGSGKIVTRPKEEWIKIPNAHPAIITTDMWHNVYKAKYLANPNKQQRFNPNIQQKKDTIRVLYKKVVCGYCGHIMRYRNDINKRYKKEYKYYCCETPWYTNEFVCTSKNYISAEIEAAVMEVLKIHIAFMFDLEKKCIEIKKSIQKNNDNAREHTKRIDSEIERLQRSKQPLYERFGIGKISEDEYMEQREDIENKIVGKIAERDRSLSKYSNLIYSIENTLRFFSQFTEFKTVEDLTADHVNALVKAVYVYNKGLIEIKFNFNDELQKLAIPK